MNLPNLPYLLVPHELSDEAARAGPRGLDRDRDLISGIF